MKGGGGGIILGSLMWDYKVSAFRVPIIFYHFPR